MFSPEQSHTTTIPPGVPVQFDPPRTSALQQIKTHIVRRGLDGSRTGFRYAQRAFELFPELSSI